MFHKFANQEDRKHFGGSAFIELQFCKMKAGTKLKKLITTKSIDPWHNDSLYIHVDDVDNFTKLYSEIFNTGIHNDLSTGFVDVFGINYYSLDDTLNMINLLKLRKPKDYLLLIDWLNRVSNFNGFYLLGI